MNIKDATKTINAELKKLKIEVGQWHLKREEIFESLREVVQKNHDNALISISSKNSAAEIVKDLKDYEKETLKYIKNFTKKTLILNGEYSTKIKDLSKDLGEISSPYLNTIKGFSFGTNIKAQATIEDEITNFIDTDCHKEFLLEPLVKKLSKKMRITIKSFNNNPNPNNQKEHLQLISKTELFVTSLLEQLKSPIQFSKVTREWIDLNANISPLVYEFESKALIEKIENFLENFNSSDNNLVLKQLVHSYGSLADNDSLKRSKDALKGAKTSLNYFEKYFGEDLLEDLSRVTTGMSSMYLNDVMDHLNLAKACFINDHIKMYEKYDMDTASRDLMSDSLHDYLNSDDFLDKVNNQKKSKIKVK